MRYEHFQEMRLRIMGLAYVVEMSKMQAQCQKRPKKMGWKIILISAILCLYFPSIIFTLMWSRDNARIAKRIETMSFKADLGVCAFFLGLFVWLLVG